MQVRTDFENAPRDRQIAVRVKGYETKEDKINDIQVNEKEWFIAIPALFKAELFTLRVECERYEIAKNGELTFFYDVKVKEWMELPE